MGRQRRGRRTPLRDDYEAVLADYAESLGCSTLTAETRRTYVSRVRQFLAWITCGRELYDGALVFSLVGQCAALDYRFHLLYDAERPYSAHYMNSALAAIDDFYRFLGMEPLRVPREPIRSSTCPDLDERAQHAWIWAAHICPSSRDTALGLMALDLGLRIGQIAALNTSDVVLDDDTRVRGTAVRAGIGRALRDWLADRSRWPDADHEPALFLNYRGGRLSARSIHTVLSRIADRGGLGNHAVRRVLRFRPPADSG
jgi:integrase/recombinase XerC